MTERMVRWLAAGPVVAATVLVAVYTGFELLGFRPLTDRPLNVAEAVVEDDPPQVVRLLRAGGDSLARYPIGNDLMRPVPRRSITPMEAAALRDRAGILGLLMARGLPIEDADRAHLLCIAGRAHAKDVLTLLAQPGIEAVCGPDADEVIAAPTGETR